MTPSSGLMPAFPHPVFPLHAVSLSTFSVSCAPHSPGLLVRLHFVSIFSDLPFRSLQVSGLYISWLDTCLRYRTFPLTFSFPSISSILSDSDLPCELTRESFNLASPERAHVCGIILTSSRMVSVRCHWVSASFHRLFQHHN